MFGHMASLLVTDEALSVSDVLRFFTRREIDFVNVHSIQIRARGSAGQQDITISSSSEFLESYYIAVKLSCFVEPLFPFPTSLFLTVREGGSDHHNGELLGYSSLEGIHEDAVIINSTMHLGQFKSGGALVEVTIELVHAEGIDSLAGSVLDILQNEGFLEGFAYLFESLFRVWDDWVGQLEAPSFVMVEEAPTSFSPFPLVDCTLLSHFSFTDFITIAFLDLARDLDIQI